MHTLEQLRSGQLAGATRVKLSWGLTAFPEEIFDLADTLEILDLSGNHLTDLPADITRLKKLRILFCSDNDFTVFPEVLSQCPHLEMIGFKANRIAHIAEEAFPVKLRWLILTNNQVKEIPRSIGNCARMQKLMLAGNRLQEVPEALAACQNLGLLRIAANNIDQFPYWLLSMPRLSWLAYSGNPFAIDPVMGTDLSNITWNALTLTALLGEGASGIISRASWQQDSLAQEVAVKVFKGAVTSDGIPADEMKACIAAGVHPNLVKVLGQLQDHPEQKQGLVLALIPPSFKNLGGPPSFDTCTRDVYPEHTFFSLSQALRIASSIASAAAHLHTKGIMHGDLYAHNTLVDEAGNTLFGDFGAACFYDTTDTVMAPALERIEVSAFGCLLDDLLVRLEPASLQEVMVPALLQLRDDCMQPVVLQRPGFKEIGEVLAGI